ncbi:GAF domain-containing sensor histidine kinase [Euhalothece natronophila Z-M001]|uniref:histidine kinase n=1 Tax=Euhalothece natronophila Z-M001 TaxID=522448 RepID=A0A5B8NII2_9CHRO|nr:GAF domain-containing sensor histidine kinase [Euhalothece natronophila]QDZ38764.1 GAF domain-containing sensor histidine kinase [Euhalothece natronophila Z-M001]
MSHQVNQLLFPASSEFTALCRSQVTNLQEGLNADRGAVYLTKELESGTRQLIPVVVHPQDSNIWEEEIEDGTVVQADDNSLASSPSLPNSAEITPQLTTTESNFLSAKNQSNHHQIVFPLLHENVMMGLLVVARQQAQWSEWEFTQIQRTAGTIALACVLDQRQGLSQQKLHQQKLQQAQQRDHLDDILHQLRNPLTALRTFGKLLLKGLQPEDQKNRSLAENLMRESDRLQQLLQDMGDYLDQIGEEEVTIASEKKSLLEGSSQVKSLPASQAPSLEAVQVREVLTPILDSISAIAQDKNITLETDIPEQLSPVQANTKALQEVCNNLLENAVKYTPENGAIAVYVSQDSPESQQIMIRDNGPGIPPEDQPKIFERHYRGIQSESDIPGTGLGLAIAKEYVEQMQGEIELMSPTTPPTNPTHGTAFIIRLKTA